MDIEAGIGVHEGGVATHGRRRSWRFTNGGDSRAFDLPPIELNIANACLATYPAASAVRLLLVTFHLATFARFTSTTLFDLPRLQR